MKEIKEEREIFHVFETFPTTVLKPTIYAFSKKWYLIICLRFSGCLG